MKKGLLIRTRVRLIFGFSIVILAAIAFALIARKNQTKVSEMNEEAKRLNEISYSLQGLRSNSNRLTILHHEYLFDIHIESEKEMVEQIKSKKNDIYSRLDYIDSLLIESNIKHDLFLTIKRDFMTYFAGYDKLLELTVQNKREEAKTLLVKEQQVVYENIRVNTLKLEEVVDHKITVNEVEYKRIEKKVSDSIKLLGFILISLTTILAVWVLYLLRKISEEIKSGVEIISKSTTDILSTITQISTGAAETATAVSETTTTIEEVRQTALISNQKAQSLLQSSQKASDSADKGRDSVHKVEEAMENIDKQMKLISATVAKLSEQNRVIADITSTVSDIADQSNLLAVNAAIEAAKAGEQGRGFAILAQEIRNLADQSKRATIQVKEIINEVNKSANLAVGVTEQGAHTVDAGMALVHQSGDVIDILAENVEEAAEAAIQISSSTRQQMAGMDQIVPAMENIKKASEQNSDGIKLTQEAVQNIHHLGKNLQSVILKHNL